MLKRFVKKIEDVPEHFRDEYVKVDGGYRLNVDFAGGDDDDSGGDDDDSGGDVEKMRRKVREFRKNNERLMREKEALEEKYRGVDPEVVARAAKVEEQARNAEERELMRQGKWDEVFERRDARMKAAHEAEMAKLSAEAEKHRTRASTLEKSMFSDRVKARVTDAINKMKVKVRPEAMADVYRRALETFTALDEDGNLMAMDGEDRRQWEDSDYNEAHFVQEIVKDAPHYLMEAQGGDFGERGGRGRRSAGGRPVVDVDPNNPLSMADNIEDVARGRAVARIVPGS